MKKFLFIIPSGGVCNRMRSIVGAAKLARIQNRYLIVIWLLKPECNARFDSLFEKLPYIVFNFRPDSFFYKVFCKIIFFCYKPVYIDDNLIITKGNKQIGDQWQEEFINNNLYLYTCYNVTQDSDFSIFKIQNNLRSRVPSFPIDNFIGIHIRRTDNKQSILNSPTSLFLDLVAEEISHNSNQKFFLATDDIKEERIFKEKYPQNIVIFSKKSLDRNTPEAIQDAVIDLFILSNCKFIWGSYYSSFSDVAALWGKIDKYVVKK